MKKISYSLILFFLFISGVTAQKKLGKEQLVADADTLHTRMYDIHPNLFAVFPQTEFEEDMAKAKSQFRDSMTVVDFYRIINPLVVKLEDGHTSVSVPAGLIDKNKKIVFPFEVDIDKKKYDVTVKNNYSEKDIPAGAKVLSINGRSTRDILNKFLTYASGENNLFKFERVKWNFHLFPYMIYGDSVFSITYQTGDEKKTVSLNGITLGQYNEITAKNKKEEKKEVKEDFVLTVDNENNTAIIDFRSFSDHDKFVAFLDSTFTLIKKQDIKNLIIDLRENGGGNSRLGDELFQYISPVPFQQFGKMEMKVSPTLKRIFNDTIRTLGISTYEGELEDLRENDKRFSGNCYLLSSNHTFSSAADFTWTFHYFKMGKVVGEETGGLIVCYGDVASSKLPNTGMRFGTSWKKFYGYGADDSYTHGVKPDYEVPADKALDYTIRLIKSQK
ncbi:hypothetical protein GGR21_000256 [Dysgonomonas hofstadii]|uniref:Tail specific protease domain-containing protein n=1 Tax=Dysgonomonas hofstadii TaxID=637886 RepID=A0A840CGM4_9BACT|nr:S41 family peptidase [Dysgonomonas hofstadii]MBB4034371.1 hypothetical protein [Dysgonomonas hofstadii]